MRTSFQILMIAALGLFAGVDSAAQNSLGDGQQTNRGGFGNREGFGNRGGFGNREGFGNRGNFGGRGGRMFRNPRAEAEKKLKEQYPAEWAEIQKLRDEAEKKLQELAKKANIELPELPKSMEERMAELKKKFPKEYAEYEELLKTDRFAAFAKMREMMMKNNPQQASEAPVPQPPEVNRQNSGRQIAQVQRKYPEDWKKIQEVRKTDPVKAQQMLRDLIQKMEKESGK